MWDSGSPIEPGHIDELMVRMGLNQSQLARVMEISQQHVNRLVNGKAEVLEGPTRVLLRWLFAVYGIDGGRAPTPTIPVEILPSRAGGKQTTG
jgi:transcriptional regulator with XRE-family HTH domain